MRRVARDAIAAMDRRLVAERAASLEQYKRPCLLTTPGEDDELLAIGT